MTETAIKYEWDIETYDDEDIAEHNFADSLADLPPLEADQKLVLVCNDYRSPDGSLRMWAYVCPQKGLPAFFEDACEQPLRKVPQRFRAELATHWPRIRGAA